MRRFFISLSLISICSGTAALAATGAPRTTAARVRTIRYHDRTPHVRVAPPTKTH